MVFMRWERLAPLICIGILLGLGFYYVVGGSGWEPGKKDFVFPGGRVRPPTWPSRAVSTAPFNGYVAWGPDGGGQAQMSLGWHYAAKTSAIEGLRKQVLAVKIEQNSAGRKGRHLGSIQPKIAREKPVLIDGHDGTQFVLQDPVKKEVVGAAYCWLCPTSRRQFTLKMLQLGASGKGVVVAGKSFLTKIRCHEAGVDPNDFERKSYRLAAQGIYKLNVLRPCAHQHRGRGGSIAFTVYWYPARLASLTAEGARAEGEVLARTFKIQPGSWRPRERSVGGHPGWEVIIHPAKGNAVLRVLLWNCEKTGKSYEVISVISLRDEGGPYDPWRSATRIECH